MLKTETKALELRVLAKFQFVESRLKTMPSQKDEIMKKSEEIYKIEKRLGV